MASNPCEVDISFHSLLSVWNEDGSFVIMQGYDPWWLGWWLFVSVMFPLLALLPLPSVKVSPKMISFFLRPCCLRFSCVFLTQKNIAAWHLFSCCTLSWLLLREGAVTRCRHAIHKELMVFLWLEVCKALLSCYLVIRHAVPRKTESTCSLV